ncbi:gamma-glutamylaminecyclotransferase isoform X3 [Vombatus ursinus]|uniref:gamma-glutamylaminecyclotransferase isoform X3 n=1 Tax=Vombatus ursinus TaxID=29139 RepID=UPI000FFD6DB2|nr:gamma-glutamylaminecyclotransferase isoform X3 [Vombatus ursinus]
MERGMVLPEGSVFVIPNTIRKCSRVFSLGRERFPGEEEYLKEPNFCFQEQDGDFRKGQWHPRGPAGWPQERGAPRDGPILLGTTLGSNQV